MIYINCRMMIGFMILLLVPTFNQLVDKEGNRICPKIDVSSNINRYSSDMVKGGITSQEWSDESTVPVIIGPDKQTDFIYFIVNMHQGENSTYDVLLIMNIR